MIMTHWLYCCEGPSRANRDAVRIGVLALLCGMAHFAPKAEAAPQSPCDVSDGLPFASDVPRSAR